MGLLDNRANLNDPTNHRYKIFITGHGKYAGVYCVHDSPWLLMTGTKSAFHHFITALTPKSGLEKNELWSKAGVIPSNGS